MRIVCGIGNLAVRSLMTAAALFSLAASLAWGQSQAINGTIRGLVSDSTGAPIAGATVTVTNNDTGYARQVKTDSSGLYVAADLTLGTYTVNVQSTGFAPVNNSGIIIQAGTSAVVNETLQPGTVTTQVEVTADAPIVDAATFDIGTTIQPRETESIPLSSRNPYNFVLFQPGVSGIVNQELGIPDYVNTNGVPDHVNYQLDGMVDTETDQYGLRLFAISQSYVNTVQTRLQLLCAGVWQYRRHHLQRHYRLRHQFRPWQCCSTSGGRRRPIRGSRCSPRHQPAPDSTLSNPSGTSAAPSSRTSSSTSAHIEYILRGEPTANTITARECGGDRSACL